MMFVRGTKDAFCTQGPWEKFKGGLTSKRLEVCLIPFLWSGVQFLDRIISCQVSPDEVLVGNCVAGLALQM
jgi:hypothetical protein